MKDDNFNPIFFTEIVEEMKSEELQREFGANQEEISAYLDYLSTH